MTAVVVVAAATVDDGKMDVTPLAHVQFWLLLLLLLLLLTMGKWMQLLSHTGDFADFCTQRRTRRCSFRWYKRRPSNYTTATNATRKYIDGQYRF